MKSQRILIIDDNHDDAVLLEAALMMAGFGGTVDKAGSVEEALHCLTLDGKHSAPNLPNAIVVDFKLGRQGCLEFLAWLKTQAAVQSVPVIVLSGMMRAREISRAYALGVKEVFLKPLALDELTQVATRVLEYASGKPVLPPEPWTFPASREAGRIRYDV